LAQISCDIKKQVALLIGRRGYVEYVIVGDDHRIVIPDPARFRSGSGRLKGLRCVHTHLHGEPLSQEDVMDLALLKLDLMACVVVDERGIPADLYYAHILPKNDSGRSWAVEHVPDIGRLEVDFSRFIRGLENELSKAGEGHGPEQKERAVLVSVTTVSREEAEQSIEELAELAKTSNLVIADTVVLRKTGLGSRILLGRGQVSELVVRSLQAGADLLIFDAELSPAQVRALTDFTEMRIIDRTQLILDIFARRAVTREGKIQVELAQLRYLLPRLITKNTAMSRLTGGIGGRGPGETKLEINRRRARERIALLNDELGKIRRQRKERRKNRSNQGLPIISIVGYTNAGKSTLLNTLTHSHVEVKDRLFVTLDPTSRRLILGDRHALITDTVGFIKDLPEDLFQAFAATLEELHEADLLIHVADISAARLDQQIDSVKEVLESLDLREMPSVLALNKVDRVDSDQAARLARNLNGIPISALNPSTLTVLKETIRDIIF
jgi:GTP-binding protein HflX